MATFVISTVRSTLSPLSLTQYSANDIFRTETIRTRNRRTIKAMTMIFPASINEIIKNKTYRIDSVGHLPRNTGRDGLFADDTYLRQNVLRRRIFARCRPSGTDTGIRLNKIMEHRYFRLPLQYESGPEIKDGRIQCKKSSGRYG